MRNNYYNINEEADVEVEAESDTKQAAIDLLKDLLDKLEDGTCPDDQEEECSVEVDSETCKESAQIIINSMKNIMESDIDTDSKLEATNILNQALYKIMVEAEIAETDGGLPEEVCENEEEEETCTVLGERQPTDVDKDADYGEGDLQESAAESLLRQMLNK